MARKRLARLLLAVPVGLLGGCALFDRPLLGRRCTECAPAVADLPCEDAGGSGGVEGPILGSEPLTAPPATLPSAPPGVVPQDTMPPLASPPRLVPQPESRPTPYTPTRNWR